MTVLGAGAWGTALAAQAATRQPTLLWARDAEQARAIARDRVNQRYLPGLALPESLQVGSDFGAALAHAGQDGWDRGLLIVATPMAGLRDMLTRLPAGAAVMWLCKGFEAGSGLLGHEIATQVAPWLHAGVLSGPSFAQEVARNQPTALVAASRDEALCRATVQALHGDSLRIYASHRPGGRRGGRGGQERAGDRHRRGRRHGQLGLNARAALITRGLAEMTRLGLALGAQAETFMGLSGLGDLVLTATGDLSRNRRVGLRLARLACPGADPPGPGPCRRGRATAHPPCWRAPARWAWTCRSPRRWWPCSKAGSPPAKRCSS
jgi:glycerol-3-phosphate dehydrogenase (NAD(P)+)